MKKQILQFLLENQGFVSLATICSTLQQPMSIIEEEIQKLETQFPQLLSIQLSYNIENAAMIKIADYQDKLARSLLV